MIEETLAITLDVPLLPYTKLTAGKLSCMYEAGNLRYIKWGDTEVVRMIYGAVRDEHWHTVMPVITNETMDAGEDHFLIRYTAKYDEGSIHYTAVFELQGKADSSIHVRMNGTALSEFQKNRIGLCVLHPLTETKGKPVTVTQPDGTVYTAVFPELIAPQQPIKNIRQLQWQPDGTVSASLVCTGDIFEMEDQRNWSDASFKTYSTPHHIPFPATVHIGEAVAQTVSLQVSGDEPVARKQPVKREAVLTADKPRIGYCKAGEQLFNFPGKTGGISIHHYRAELFLFNANWPSVLQQLVTHATTQQVKLNLVLFFDGAYDQALPLLLAEIAPVVAVIHSVLLLERGQEVTPPTLMQQGYQMIKNVFPSVSVGYGTSEHFVSLNRNRPGHLPHDFVSFGLMPQAHATDTRTILENLDSLPDMVATIRSFTDKAIHAGPVSIDNRIHHQADTESEYYIDSADERSTTAFADDWKQHCLHLLAHAECVSFL